MSIHIKSRKPVAALATVIAVFVIAALLYLLKIDAFGAAKKPPMTEHKTERSAWIADWQWEIGMKDLNGFSGSLNSLQMFAAYFDVNDRLWFTDDFHEMQPKIKELVSQNTLSHVDLTLVNDIKYPDRIGVQKDSSLVTRLTGTEEGRNRHIEDIVEAVELYGFQGVEIDYENIGNDDWNNVVLLISELHLRLQSMGKTLRIVLEPRAPIEKLKLPQGPTYVMMAYNLYGGHSGPGPKADHAFIKELSLRLKHLPGKPYIALSAGGFDWSSDSEEVNSLTEKQAEELSKLSMSSPVRDPDSGSVYFEYMDADNVKHTVWYADQVTMSEWIAVARKAGCYNIALWRLGELGQGTLESVGRTSRTTSAVTAS